MWLCTVDNQLMNGELTEAVFESTDTVVCNSADVGNPADSGPERCHLAEAGDQIPNHIESPLTATSSTSENGEDCCAPASSNEDCLNGGAFVVFLFILKTSVTIAGFFLLYVVFLCHFLQCFFGGRG